MTKLIFINENENVFEICTKYGCLADIKHLEFISLKVKNNYIGYYQFLENDVYHKIYILPKTTKRIESDNEKNKKNFINLLSEYYKLKNKYKVIKSKKIDNNIIDFSLEDKNQNDKSDKIDDFIIYKYDNALQIIENFFKKHKNSLIKEKKFFDNTIKYKLDLKQNIVEIDKSKVHQIKKEPYFYSKIAVISIEVLHHFIKYKTKHQKAQKLKNKIEAKFILNSYKIVIQEIVSKKIVKLFKTKEEKELYLALLILLGIENYFEDNSYKKILKFHNQHSCFFRPEKLFEWKVYDTLINSEEFSQLYYEGKHSKITIKNFYLQCREEKIKDFDSQPDFIGIKNGEKYIIDAKWKIVDMPKEKDIFKLYRDAKIRNCKKGILIYPMKMKSKNFNLEINKEYSFNYLKDFSFEIRIIKI